MKLLVEDNSHFEVYTRIYSINNTNVEFCYHSSLKYISVWYQNTSTPLFGTNYSEIINYSEEQIFQYSTINEWIECVYKFAKLIPEKYLS